MSRTRTRTKTIRTDYLARVEGEGGMTVKIRDGACCCTAAIIARVSFGVESFAMAAAYALSTERINSPNPQNLPER